jgi:hypothetical protein
LPRIATRKYPTDGIALSTLRSGRFELDVVVRSTDVSHEPGYADFAKRKPGKTEEEKMSCARSRRRRLLSIAANSLTPILEQQSDYSYKADAGRTRLRILPRQQRDRPRYNVES